MGVFGCLGYHFKARKNLYEEPPLLYEAPPLATEWDTLEDFDRLCAGTRKGFHGVTQPFWVMGAIPNQLQAGNGGGSKCAEQIQMILHRNSQMVGLLPP